LFVCLFDAAIFKNIAFYIFGYYATLISNFTLKVKYNGGCYDENQAFILVND